MLYPFVHRFVGRQKFSTHLGKYQGVTAGSYGKSMIALVRKHQTIFHSDCTSLYSQQQSAKVPVAQHPHEHLVLLVF